MGSAHTNGREWALLWCERCGHAQEPQPVPEMPSFTVLPDAPLLCADCDGLLTLVACRLHDASVMWQEGGRGNGGSIHHVATIGALERI